METYKNDSQSENATPNSAANPERFDKNSEPPQNNPEPGKTTSHQQSNPGTDPGQTQDKASTKPEQSRDCPGSVPGTSANSGTTPTRLDPLQEEIEEEIAASHEPLSPLDRLPAEQQELLYELLNHHSLRRVREAIAKPVPKGFDLQIGIGALNRFKKRYTKRDQLQKKNALGLIASQLLNEPAVADEGYVTASERLLKIRLLEANNNPDARTSEIRDLFQTLVRLRAQNVSEKRLKLAERKLSNS